ncbi:MAG TPA: NfeD family protein [Spirochaetia bacterium]|nr:NfeD family protein [Spirochaetia bacterium]
MSGLSTLRVAWILVFPVLLVIPQAIAVAQPSSSRVVAASVRGYLDPVSERYVERVLETARSAGVARVILHVDVTGGLPRSVARLAAAIRASRVPVTVQLSPNAGSPGAGSRTASAAGALLAKAADTTTGRELPPQAAAATITYVHESVWERVLSALLAPNTAYVLFILGILAILVELSIPGIGLPGITGTISVLLSLLAFGVFSVNVAGIGIILFGAILFIVDLKASTHGVLSAGGIVAVLAGSFMLFPGSPQSAVPGIAGPQISPLTIFVMTSLLALFFATAVMKGLGVQRRAVTTGPDVLIGQDGIALTALGPDGTVRVANEEWSAQSLEGEIAEGADVTVVASEGIHLVVIRKGW